MKYKSKEDIEAAKELISKPGDTLLETILNKGISQTELATRMGRPVKTINEIINGKAALMPETALQLERVLGVSSKFWQELERLYRLELAEIEEAELMLSSAEWIKNFPLKEMLKMGWIEYEKNVLSETNALLSYFSVASKVSFIKYYNENLYSAAFRISNKDSKNSYAIAAWLRRGEVQSEQLKAAEFDAKSFKNALTDIKKLMVKEQDNFFDKLQNICLKTGVKVVHTACLPKAPISGATRWYNDNPLIQLTCRYKRNDIYWFTFFHEAGHILLHGKKDIFIEDITHSKDIKQKEKEADDFAANWLLSEKEEKEILSEKHLAIGSITKYAKQFGTLPSVIVGRFEKEGRIHPSFGWSHEIYKKVELNDTV